MSLLKPQAALTQVAAPQKAQRLYEETLRSVAMIPALAVTVRNTKSAAAESANTSAVTYLKKAVRILISDGLFICSILINFSHRLTKFANQRSPHSLSLYKKT